MDVFGKELPTLLAICSFCGCLIVFVCLLVLGASCGSDCISSWVHLFTLLAFHSRKCFSKYNLSLFVCLFVSAHVVGVH